MIEPTIDNLLPFNFTAVAAKLLKNKFLVVGIIVAAVVIDKSIKNEKSISKKEEDEAKLTSS